MKIFFLIISCICAFEISLKLKIKENLKSIKVNLIDYFQEFTKIDSGEQKNIFKKFYNISVEYLKIIVKLTIMLTPIIIYVSALFLLDKDIFGFFLSLKVNLITIFVLLIYIFFRKKIE